MNHLCYIYSLYGQWCLADASGQSIGNHNLGLTISRNNSVSIREWLTIWSWNILKKLKKHFYIFTISHRWDGTVLLAYKNASTVKWFMWLKSSWRQKGPFMLHNVRLTIWRHWSQTVSPHDIDIQYSGCSWRRNYQQRYCTIYHQMYTISHLSQWSWKNVVMVFKV